jgi:carbon-monoxide dehydrogenase medium subunit
MEMNGEQRIAATRERVWAALTGQVFTDIDPEAIADTAPFTDHHASAEYRRTVSRRIFAGTLRPALAIKEPA